MAFIDGKEVFLVHTSEGGGSSGGGVEQFVVNFTNTGGTLTADKTFAEIRQAVADGKVVIGRDNNNENVYQLFYEQNDGIDFGRFEVHDDHTYMEMLYISPNGVVEQVEQRLSGGADVFVVEFSGSGNEFTANYTYEQVEQALEDNKVVLAQYENRVYTFGNKRRVSTGGRVKGQITFTLTQSTNTSVKTTTLYLYSDNTAEYGTQTATIGGSCAITDLGEQEDPPTAIETIISLLAPETVPTGNYLYTYYTNCKSDAQFVICYKNEAIIEGVQFTTSNGGQYRPFTYDIETEESVFDCFLSFRNTEYQAGNNVEFTYDENDNAVINVNRPKLYAPSIKISGTTLTIKNPTKNKDLVGSYDIYIMEEDYSYVIRNTKRTTVDLSALSIDSGTYNIAVKAKSITFNGTTLYDDSDYSNTIEYTHDMLPRLNRGAEWYKGTVDKSTITEITFDNTYQVTGNETESWDASWDSDQSVMCYLNGTRLTIKPIHATNRVITSNCYRMFYGFNSLTAINNLTALDTSNVTDMEWLFYGCTALTSLDVSNFDTSKVTNMIAMFCSCKALTSLDLSNFDTSNITDMSQMFHSCSALTSLDVSSFDTSNVTDMGSLFCKCYALTSLDVSNFDTSSVTDMFAMFQDCSALTSLDLSNFDTSNVTDMKQMFLRCGALTSLDVSNFDTSNVTDISIMFEDCIKLTVDCSDWEVGNATAYYDFNRNAPNVTPPQWVN